jgi:D-cysteine desulfhydrase
MTDGPRVPRLPLSHTPTPLWRPERLADALGVDLWIKRDDATGGPEAGNKVRKLEYLVADALAQGADTLVTCGGLQSNHARATAVVAARLGLGAVSLLRVDDPSAPLPHTGNVLLQRLVGAELVPISREAYADRDAVMADHAARLRAAGRRPYLIPEGGSNGRGALGYVRAMAEVRRQLDLGLGGRARFDAIVHACGSGGTTSGITLGAARYEVASDVYAIATCEDAATFRAITRRIMEEARGLDASLEAEAPLHVDDRFTSGTDPEGTSIRDTIADVAKASGLVLDPTYTAKAWQGLSTLVREGQLASKRVLFVHSGGLPALLAAGPDLFGDG